MSIHFGFNVVQQINKLLPVVLLTKNATFAAAKPYCGASTRQVYARTGVFGRAQTLWRSIRAQPQGHGRA
ncbi:MAG: hypothetical protein ACTS6O_14615, partial [Giesbergeria sp.]